MLYTWFYLVFSYSYIIINSDLVLVRKYPNRISLEGLMLANDNLR